MTDRTARQGAPGRQVARRTPALAGEVLPAGRRPAVDRRARLGQVVEGRHVHTRAEAPRSRVWVRVASVVGLAGALCFALGWALAWWIGAALFHLAGALIVIVTAVLALTGLARTAGGRHCPGCAR